MLHFYLRQMQSEVPAKKSGLFSELSGCCEAGAYQRHYKRKYIFHKGIMNWFMV